MCFPESAVIYREILRAGRPCTAIEEQKGEPMRMVNSAAWYLFVSGSIPQNVNKPYYGLNYQCAQNKIGPYYGLPDQSSRSRIGGFRIGRTTKHESLIFSYCLCDLVNLSVIIQPFEIG